MTPTQNAPNTLSVDIPYLNGSAPQVSHVVYPSTKTVSVNFTFIRDSVGTMPGGISDANAYIASRLADVNKVFAQAGMLFVHGGVSYVDQNDWYNAPASSSYDAYTNVLTQIVTSRPAYYGIKVFVINSFIRPDFSVENRAVTVPVNGFVHGVVFPAVFTGVILAHEIGHVCGLNDIYDDVSFFGGPSFPILSQSVTQTDLPLDWTGVNGYYESTLTKAGIIPRLLMFGRHSITGSHLDIPRGEIFGIGNSTSQQSFSTGLINVGLSGLNRDPSCY